MASAVPSQIGGVVTIDCALVLSQILVRRQGPGIRLPLMLNNLVKRTRYSKSLWRNRKHPRANLMNSAMPGDESVNAFISISLPDLEQLERHSDFTGGSLQDLKIAIKDNICTANLPTTCSSAMLEEFRPGYDATVVKLLKGEGAILAGKTNCDEFGMGSLNINSIAGPVFNPWQSHLDDKPWIDREKRSAGGSSGGSAAAVASKQCFAAIGTDTGGSIRLPASYCGVVGFKPSYGLLSRWGVISFADSLDTVGIIASNVEDVQKVYDALSWYDSKDPTSIPFDKRMYSKSSAEGSKVTTKMSDPFKGLRIGIPREYFPSELDPSLVQPLREVISEMQRLGAEAVSVSLPSTPYALSAYYVLASAEASSNMARYDGVRYGEYVEPPINVNKNKTADVYAYSRSRGFGREVQKRILLGTYALTADAFDNYYLRAQQLRTRVQDDFNKVFRCPNELTDSSSSFNDDGVDVLLHLSAIRTAPPLSEASSQGIETYVQDALTVPASLAGLPAISIPAGLGSDGFPIGVSVVGQWGTDDHVMRVGQWIEECTKLTKSGCEFHRHLNKQEISETDFETGPVYRCPPQKLL